VRAESVCFAPPVDTGYSWGPTTLGISMKSGNAASLTSGPKCAPDFPLSVPNIVDSGGTGTAITSANQNGLYNGASTLTSPNGPYVGTGRATSASNLEVMFRLNTTAAYAGTGTEMLDWVLDIIGGGNGYASGPGSSFGGTYDFDAGVHLYNGAGVQLLTGNGAATQSSFGGLFSGSTPVLTDTDYVFSIHQQLQLTSSGSYDGFTFGTGYAESAITTLFELALPALVEGVAIEFRMQSALGLAAPSIAGAAPAAVPLPAAGVLLWSGLLGLGAVLSRRRMRL
jgi:hypothetical protein